MSDNRKRPQFNSSLAIRSIKPTESIPDFAKRVGLSATCIQKLIGKTHGVNPRVLLSTIVEFCKATGNNIDDAIVNSSGNMPDEAEFFTSLRYGWFVDNSRHKFLGEDTWYWEEISFEPVVNGSEGRLSFIGQIKNCLGVSFEARAERLNDHLFYVVGSSENSRLSFVGCANHYHLYEEIVGIRKRIEILIGSWAGSDLAGDPAVYRWILSTELLARSDIESICDDTPIREYFTAGRFHETIDE